MSDRQLMAALQKAKPQKCGAPTPASAGDVGAAREKQEDRALEEVMAAAGCPIGSEREWDPKKHRRDMTRVFCEALGVSNSEIAARLVLQIANVMNHGQSESEAIAFLAAIAMMQEIKPTNATEAMLACQMVGVHHAAMKFVYLATLPGQPLEGMEATANLAIRMMRMYTVQFETLAKLRGQAGQQSAMPQRAAVEQHVTVQDGGQAIVSAVVTPDPGAGGKSQ